MINVEELKLYLLVERLDSTYINGIQMYDQILIYMPQLNKFTFSIKTRVINKNIKINLSSNEDIQHSFIGKIYGRVGSYVDCRSMGTEGRCHVYSLPYEFEYFIKLDTAFPGGMFSKVRYLMMTDVRPFQRELFKVISQDFPYLECLYICNHKEEKDTQDACTLHFLTLHIFIYSRHI
jgi:hypothetical protein